MAGPTVPTAILSVYKAPFSNAISRPSVPLPKPTPSKCMQPCAKRNPFGLFFTETRTQIDRVQQLRAEGLPVYFTIDAGPNVKLLFQAAHIPEIETAFPALEIIDPFELPMPELPEVETIARQLRERGVEGREILAVRIDWPRMVEPLTPTAFTQAICGTKIKTISRTGKWIQIELSSGQHWMVHLRMAGSFSKRRSKFDRGEILLSGGMKLYFRDTRKFGRWKLVDDPQDILSKLGPDALSTSFTGAYFESLVTTRKRAIKPLLLDQALIAGIGNIYADEALWETAIHPQRSSSSLNPQDCRSPLSSHPSRSPHRRSKPRDFARRGQTNYRDMNGESGQHRQRVKAYGRRGLPCERCKTPSLKSSSPNVEPPSVLRASGSTHFRTIFCKHSDLHAIIFKYIYFFEKHISNRRNKNG